MISGFNHNIQHQGKLWHIQTEDSGLANPHVITLLYLGGNIIAKKKTSYQQLTQDDNLPKLVREIMEEQHKAMLRDLIRGGFAGVPSKTEADLANQAPGVPSQPGLPSSQSQKPPLAHQAPVPPPAPSVASPPPSASPPPVPAKPAPSSSTPSSTAYQHLAEEQQVAPEIKATEIDSLFGSGKDEKSLDEIILSYLSDDN